MRGSFEFNSLSSPKMKKNPVLPYASHCSSDPPSRKGHENSPLSPVQPAALWKRLTVQVITCHFRRKIQSDFLVSGSWFISGSNTPFTPNYSRGQSTTASKQQSAFKEANFSDAKIYYPSKLIELPSTTAIWFWLPSLYALFLSTLMPQYPKVVQLRWDKAELNKFS